LHWRGHKLQIEPVFAKTVGAELVPASA
jgi:hypothetical protein